jgi:carbonic anhydrase
MSCLNSTAPIDINPANVKGTCDYKCSYSFNYNNSSCVAKNQGDYISLKYDASSAPPVVYNSIGYQVSDIRIYSPSLHSYSGNKTIGEFIIVHTSATGATSMLVCIPIKVNNTSSTSALFLQSVIDGMSNYAPEEGDSTTINITSFNLCDLVPQKPFYSYSATEPYQPCTSNVDYIVFHPLDATLDIMIGSIMKLKKIIVNNAYDIKTGPNFFYNETGSLKGGASGEDIYIDCQPVGQSTDSQDVVTQDYSSTSGDYKSWKSNPLVLIILGTVIFIALIFAVQWFLSIWKIPDEIKKLHKAKP